MKIVYPGTFDPITYGHLDIIRRAVGIFENIEVAIVKKSKKELFFTDSERAEMVRESLKEEGIKNTSVIVFDCLLVDYMLRNGYNVFIRGLRATFDFEFELQMQLINRKLAPGITGLYLMPSSNNIYLSSTVVKEIAGYNGNVSPFVPKCVEIILKEKQV